LCITAAIGAAIGGVVGGVGYGIYAASTGKFNGWYLAAAIGGGALAGALIGTGVGWAAGVGVAEATAAAATAGGVAEAANAACGGDMCASEVQDGSNLMRYIHPNDILQNGEVMSRAFRDPTMSVFDQSLGATPELVLKTQSTAAGVAGQGGVMGLDPNTLSNVTGVSGIVQELGTTGNDILYTAHKVV
jgi:hypothetical protein